MGTMFTLRAAGAIEAVGTALDSIASLEARLTNWSATSELSRLNAAGEAEMSEPLGAVVDSALALASLTGGAFDPTVEPLIVAWDIRGKGRVPRASEIAAARAHVGWTRVRRGGAHVALGGAALDLGGIGKGFALDRAAAVLRAHGVRTATLDAGGQLLALGAAPCSTWVAHPEKRDAPAVRVVVRDGSLSTSAQSERSVRASGRRIGHVLDPRTGQPVATRASVSAWAPSGTRADALSTALLVMGPARAAEFAREHPSIGVLWLEPIGRRVRADAWNLEILEVVPQVDLIIHSPTSLPITHLPGRP
jgi:thiamine biosynthesis lipoprotein